MREGGTSFEDGGAAALPRRGREERPSAALDARLCPPEHRAVLCPRCHDELTDSALGLFDDIPVHECGSCGGAFYPPGSLDRLDDDVTVNAETLAYALVRDDARLACPRCTTASLYRTESTVALQSLSHARGSGLARCPQCGGFWLERGALDRLRRLVLEQR
jgi:Zn-finger nucleic acid-binding protein